MMNTSGVKADKSAPAWIGIDIGGTKTAVLLSIAPPELVARVEFPTLPDQGPERALQKIEKTTAEMLDLAQLKGVCPAAIGISCGGPLNSKTGVIQAPPNLSTWVDVPIVDRLKQRFGLPCQLENDANAGAIAENRFGAGRGARHMIFVTMGTGFGAGLICDGKLLSGATGQAGEIGHIRLTPTGPVGYHKAGSVEGWVSGGGLAQIAAAEVQAARARGEKTSLAAIFDDEGALTAKDLSLAAQNGDPLAQRIIHDTGLRLGEALAILIDLFNPERIVVGGLGPRFGEPLLAPARARIREEALPGPASLCQILPATLGERIGDVAALSIAMGIETVCNRPEHGAPHPLQ